MPLLTPNTATTIELHPKSHLGHNGAGTFQFLLTPTRALRRGRFFVGLHSWGDQSLPPSERISGLSCRDNQERS